MSEVLGDGEPHDEPGGDDIEDLFADGYDDPLAEIDDGFRKPIVLPAALRPMVEPGALAIVSLVLGALSLIGQFVGGTVVEALAVAHLNADPLSSVYTTRAAAIVSLVVAFIAAGCGLGATSGAARAEEPTAHKNSRAMAGAGLGLALLSIAISVVALIILATVHVDTNPLDF